MGTREQHLQGLCNAREDRDEGQRSGPSLVSSLVRVEKMRVL